MNSIIYNLYNQYMWYYLIFRAIFLEIEKSKAML